MPQPEQVSHRPARRPFDGHTGLYCFPQGVLLREETRRYRNRGLKKPFAIRIDADLPAAMRNCARRDNRTLTNFIETALRHRIEAMTEGEPEPSPAVRPSPAIKPTIEPSPAIMEESEA